MNTSGGALNFDAIMNDSQMMAAIRRVNSGISSMASNAQTETSKMDDMFKTLAVGIGGYFSVQALGAFKDKLISVRGEFEQIQVSFRTMLGDKNAADMLFNQAVQFAMTTPNTLLDVANGTKSLLAYQFTAKEIIPTLEMLGNVGAGVSVGMKDMVYLYGTTRTQGRLYTRDLMQFTSRGIPMIHELAKVMGIADNEVQNFVESGKVGFEQVQLAFQAMSSQGGMFYNLMKDQSKTVTGMMSNLTDAIDKALNDIGQSNDGIIKGSIAGATSLVNNYQSVIDILKVLIATYGTYKAAMMFTSSANNVIGNSRNAIEIKEIEKILSLEQKEMLSKQRLAVYSAYLEKNNLKNSPKEFSKFSKTDEYYQETKDYAKAELEAKRIRVAELQSEVDETRKSLDLKREQHAASLQVIEQKKLEVASLASVAKADTITSLTKQKNAASEAQSKAALNVVKLQEQKTSLISAVRDLEEKGATEKKIVAKTRDIATISEKIVAAKSEEVQQGRIVIAKRAEIASTTEGIISKKAETAVKQLNTAIEKENTLAQEVNSASTSLNSKRVALATTMQRANTLDTGLNTAAKVANTESSMALFFANFRLSVIQAQLNAVIMANPYVIAAAALVGLVAAVYLFASAESDAEKVQKRHIQVREDAKNKIDEEKAKTEALISTARNEKIAIEDREKAIQKLHDTGNPYLKQLSTQNILTGEGVELLKSYNTQLEHETYLMAFQDEKAELIKKKVATQRELVAAEKELKNRDASVKELNENPYTTSVASRGSEIMAGRSEDKVKSLNAQIKAYKDGLDAIAAEEAQFSKTNKATAEEAFADDKAAWEAKLQTATNTLEKISMVNTEKLRSGNTSGLPKGTVESYKQALKDKAAAEKALQTWDYKKDLKDKQSTEKEGLVSEKKSFEDLLHDKKSQYELYYRWVKSMGSDAADTEFVDLISSGRSFAEYINKQITDLEGKKNLTKEDKQSLGILKNKRQDAIDIDNNSYMDKFKSNIDDKVGKYKELADQVKYLSDMLEVLQSKNDGTKESQEKIDYVATLFNSKHTDYAKETTEMTYQFMTYQQKRVEIVRKGNSDILRLNNTNNTDQAKEREKALKDELAQLDDQQNERMHKYDMFNVDLANASVKGLQFMITQANEILKQSDLPEDRKREIKKFIDDINQASDDKLLKKGETNLFDFKGIKKQLADVKKMKAEIAKMPDGVEKVKAEAAANKEEADAKQKIISKIQSISQSTSELGSIIGQVNQGWGEAINLVGSLGNAAAKFVAGDYIGGSISAVSSVLSYIINTNKRAQEQAAKEEQARFQELTDTLSGLVKILERQEKLIGLAFGADKVSAFSNAIKMANSDLDTTAVNLNQAITLFNKKHQGERNYKPLKEIPISYSYGIGRGGIKLPDVIADQKEIQSAIDVLYDNLYNKQGQFSESERKTFEELLSSYESGQEKINQLKEDYQSYLTGTTSDSITQSIIDGFQNGYSSAADFATNFQDLMKKAVLESLKIKALEKPLADWYEQFAASSESDGQLTKEEIAALQASYNDIINNASKKFDDMKQISGINFSSSTNQNSLSGAVKGVSQETAGIIAGQMNAIRVNQELSRNLMNEQLRHLATIANNSWFLSHLESMDKKLDALKLLKP